MFDLSLTLGCKGLFRSYNFPFDVSRSNMLLHTPLLVVTFLVHRYRWRDSGIFVFSSSWGPALSLSYQLGCMERIHGEMFRWLVWWFPSLRGCCAAINIAKGLTPPYDDDSRIWAFPRCLWKRIAAATDVVSERWHVQCMFSCGFSDAIFIFWREEVICFLKKDEKGKVWRKLVQTNLSWGGVRQFCSEGFTSVS